MADPWWLTRLQEQHRQDPWREDARTNTAPTPRTRGTWCAIAATHFRTAAGQQAPANCGDPGRPSAALYGGKPFIVFQPSGNATVAAAAWPMTPASRWRWARPARSRTSRWATRSCRHGRRPEDLAADPDPLQFGHRRRFQQFHDPGAFRRPRLARIGHLDPQPAVPVAGQEAQAPRLVPGQDHLVRPDGSTVPVLDLVSGKFSKGVHMISTSNATTTDMAGHLIIANGVICGDYSLQLTHLEEAKPSLMAARRNCRNSAPRNTACATSTCSPTRSRRTSPPPSWTWPPNTRKAVRRVSRPTRWSARCRSPRTPPPS